MRAIRIKEVIQKVSLSQSTIYAMIAKGSFPSPFELTPGRVAWDEEEVDAWLAEKKAARVPTFSAPLSAVGVMLA